MSGKSERFIARSSGSTLAKLSTVVHVPPVTERGSPLGAVTDDGVFFVGVAGLDRLSTHSGRNAAGWVSRCHVTKLHEQETVA